ncbi:uroporphyrinogen decarboxylase family protein [Dialister sp.]|uniref:uroporphyrinogen decarboxylase family protein n=1 Tax=Dialister sp. TaxID=1955814 RepID=UPI002E817EC3|nr:uroporphyrinogen decarboxylase family protein [Dialister sp.]MEE3452309.1 uroporphyrinogen decarboxylase family protein [Dialister sp.]
MTREERVRAALEGKEVDHVPVAAWMHLSEFDQDPISLAEAEVELTEKYDFDYIKMMPFGLYSTQDFGNQITIYCDPYKEPIVKRFAIQAPADYDTLKAIPAIMGTYGKQFEFARELSKRRTPGTPIIQTIFSPFSTLKKMAGDRLLTDMINFPEAVHHALAAITATTIDFVHYNIDAGVDGFFFATQNASRNVMNLKEFEEFGEFYDLQVINSYVKKTWFNPAHIHGNDVYFNEIAEYPINCINWHDRHTWPSLKEARELTDKCLLAGIKSAPYFVDGVLQYDDIILNGTPEEITAHVKDAINQVEGRGLILGPGCVVNPKAPEENLLALRKAVEL